LGATARQAALPALRSAVKAGLTPMINGMMIAGVVSVPGMATGQILAGSDVSKALRYQILVYLLISGTVAASVMVILWIRMRTYFNKDHQLAPALDPGA
jgi:putative ABC transport system permease protein